LKADGDTHEIHEPWVVTNTHFTSQAIQYGECMGMTLLGWRYPESGGIEKLIEEEGLHPITCLQSLGKKEVKALLDQHVLLCQDVMTNTHILSTIGVSQKKQREIFNEIKTLCQV